MDEVLKVTKIKSPEEYAQRSEELFNERKELISYMEALHHKQSSGLSLYDCISEHLAIKESEISDQLPPKEQMTADYIDRCKECPLVLGCLTHKLQHATRRKQGV